MIQCLVPVMMSGPFELCVCYLNKIEKLFSSVCSFRDIVMTRNFGGIYGRRLRGPSRFVWNKDSLGIIVRGLFQFHRCGPRAVSLPVIAASLRTLICQYVRRVVCESHGYSGWTEDHFERICARWIRLPSLRAVLLKLQECDRFAYLVDRAEATYESLRADGVMSDLVYSVFDDEISRNHDSHSGCHLRDLPAIPRPCALPSWGSCFLCGSGLTDKIDLNWVSKCECLGDEGGEEVCVCSSCVPPP